jgi:hypothetical protein
MHPCRLFQEPPLVVASAETQVCDQQGFDLNYYWCAEVVRPPPLVALCPPWMLSMVRKRLGSLMLAAPPSFERASAKRVSNGHSQFPTGVEAVVAVAADAAAVVGAVIPYRMP